MLRNKRFTSLTLQDARKIRKRLCEAHVSVAGIIYEAKENGEPRSIGTASFISYDDQPMVLTAAHVAWNSRQVTLYVASDTSELIPLGSRWAATDGGLESKDDPKSFQHDIAICRLTNEQARVLGCERFHPLKSVLETDLKGGIPVAVIGFPLSRNKGRGAQRKMDGAYVVKGQRLIAMSETKEMSKQNENQQPKSSGHNPKIHMLIKFYADKFKCYREGQKFAMPKPTGISGGPVWKLDGPSPEISGFTIEYYEDIGILVATRVEVAVQVARKLLQEDAIA